MLFSKPEYEETMLPFTYIDDPEDVEKTFIEIEAYGNIYEQKIYCDISYTLKKQSMYDNDDYEQIVNMLKNSANKTVKVIFKIKKGVPKSFKIDLNSLVEAYNDERFKLLDPAGWRLSNTSIKEELHNEI